MSETIEAFAREAERGIRRLRFHPELERQFAEEHAKTALVQRLILLVFGAVLVASSPFFDTLLLSPPQSYLTAARRVQFGMILPALLLAFAFTASPQLRRWADIVGTLALLVVVCSWEYLRHLGVQHDFEVPMIMIGVVLAGAFALTGLFFWALAPVAILGLVLVASIEIWTRGPTDETLYNILALCLLALIAALSRYVQEYFQRVQWLQRRNAPAAASAQLRAASLRDPLTGLANRRRQDECLRQAFQRASTGGRAVALLFLDLDNFKSINESLGHSAGDRFLIEAAARLKRLAPEGALVCRYSGDEFTLVLEDLNPSGLEDRLSEIGRGLLKGMAEPYLSTGDFVYLTASIGIAVHPRDGQEVEQLVANAEAAMYLAKRTGRNKLQFAAAGLTEDTRRNLALGTQIRRGVAADEFAPHYQPIVDLISGHVVGVEALLRWQHPVRGLVLPDEFIRVAEAVGVIGEVGAICLRKAYAQAVAWRARGRDLRVEINLSALQLHDGELLAQLARLHEEHAVPADMIGFEITETAMMENLEESQRTLHALRQLGYRLSIDDFGTGFSALGYLQKFPVQRIKIDRGFIAKLRSSPEAPAIVSATVALGSSLGLEVVAEGVETREQMERLRDLGCVLQQGHYFSTALPVPLLEQWIAGPMQAAALLAGSSAAA